MAHCGVIVDCSGTLIVCYTILNSFSLLFFVPTDPICVQAFCGGTLIAWDTVLTAAHCFMNSYQVGVIDVFGPVWVDMRIAQWVDM